MGSKKIEWRFGKNKKTPKALIFRIASTEYDNDGMPVDVSLLHIVKLDGDNTCTVETLRPQANMNQKARAIADKIEEFDCP
jgi:hypothetical protein